MYLLCQNTKYYHLLILKVFSFPGSFYADKDRTNIKSHKTGRIK